MLRSYRNNENSEAIFSTVLCGAPIQLFNNSIFSFIIAIQCNWNTDEYG